jgi:phosphatidylglycerophosphate synthase
MVLGGRRDLHAWFTVPLVHRLKNVDPDVLSWFSLPFAIGAGVLFYFSSPENELRNGLLLLAGASVGLNALLDILDGAVARTHGKSTPRGDYLDHVLDRWADTAMVGGLALSGWVGRELGIAALAGVLLASYMGTQAQAVQMGRNYTGVLGRAERMLLLICVPVAEDIRLRLGWTFDVLGFQSLLESLMLWFAAGGAITVVQRFVDGMRWFRQKEKSSDRRPVQP